MIVKISPKVRLQPALSPPSAARVPRELLRGCAGVCGPRHGRGHRGRRRHPARGQEDGRGRGPAQRRAVRPLQGRGGGHGARAHAGAGAAQQTAEVAGYLDISNYLDINVSLYQGSSCSRTWSPPPSTSLCSTESAARRRAGCGRGTGTGCNKYFCKTSQIFSPRFRTKPLATDITQFRILALSCDRPDRLLLGQLNPWC